MNYIIFSVIRALIWFALNGSRPNSSMVRCYVPLFCGFNLNRLLWYGNTLGLSPVWSGHDLISHYSMGKYILTRLLWYGNILGLSLVWYGYNLSSHYSMGETLLNNTFFCFLFYFAFSEFLCIWVYTQANTKVYVTITSSRFSSWRILFCMIKRTLLVIYT